MKKYILVSLVAVIAVLSACSNAPEKTSSAAPALPTETTAPMPQDTIANPGLKNAEASKEKKDDDD
jgi:PBP1b-binding outer membrane lipoprotein LpoB